MSLDTALRKAAQSVLGSLGTDVTIRTVTAGAYNTTTGSGADTTADVTVHARLDSYRTSDLPEGYQAGDLLATIAAADVTAAPTPADRVVIGSVTYEIVDVTTHMAQALAALYALHIRGQS